jgi:hypothetical protein
MLDRHIALSGRKEQSMNNAALLTTDRGTHVKIVLIALNASIAVSMIGINVYGRPANSEASLQQRVGAS